MLAAIGVYSAYWLAGVRSAVLTRCRGVGGVAIAGGVGSLIHHSFSSIIIGIYEVL
jgi:hypothetical protein